MKSGSGAPDGILGAKIGIEMLGNELLWTDSLHRGLEAKKWDSRSRLQAMKTVAFHLLVSGTKL